MEIEKDDSNINNQNNELNEEEQNLLVKEFDYNIYAINFSNLIRDQIRFGVGSLIEGELNYIYIYDLNKNDKKFTLVNSIENFFSINKIMFHPNSSNDKELFATSGKYLNWYEITPENKIWMKKSFFNELNRDLNAPLTSFDWNTIDNSKIIVSSLDTTCSIYDIEEEKLIKQLIAHDLEVYDISISSDGNTFATVSADNTLRRFDQRDLSKGDILYESSKCLLKIEWNKINGNFIAINKLYENELILLDIRMPVNPYAYLTYHKKPINAFKWAPYSDIHLCTVSDDKNAFIWDINKINDIDISSPILEYENNKEIINISWNNVENDYISIVYDKEIKIIKMN